MVSGLRSRASTLIAFTVMTLPAGAVAVKGGATSTPAEPATSKFIVQEFTQAREQVISTEEDSRKILGNLYEINFKLKKMSEKRSRLSEQMLAAKGDVSLVARTIGRLENRISDQRRILSRRLRSLYKLGEQGTMQVIFSSQSASDFDRNLAYLKRVADRDVELITDFQSNLTALEQNRSKLRRNVLRMVSLEKSLKRQEGQLEDEQNSKSRLLAVLRKSKQTYIDRLSGLRQQVGSAGVAEEIASLIEESFFERKGRLLAPIRGTIAKDFGLIQDDRYKFKLNHKGVFVASDSGEPVRAVFPGQVSFVGLLEGCGHTVILDHGDHYYSVYCHHQEVKVKKHQKVTEGELLGNVGADEFGQTGLYFEIRHFSDPIDPRLWVNWKGDTPKTTL